jgi:LmbE family N-acetylglucosaminyl deacetylase
VTRIGISLACTALWLTASVASQEAFDTGRFVFQEGSSRTMSVTLTEAGGSHTFTWPELLGPRWHTALLELQVSTDVSSEPPFAEIVSPGASERQYFGIGEGGVRFLNLTFLRAAAAGTPIRLHGVGVTLHNREATLRLFDGAPDLSKRLMVLAPHPDDAEIAAFGLYAHRDAVVITVTAGNAGVPTYEAVFDDPADQYLFKGRIRLIDSITIPWQGGIPPERAFNMGYFDARLAEMYDKRDAVVPEMYRANSDINVYRRENIGRLLPMRSRESKWTHLVEDVLALLKKVKPAVVIAPHPQLDSHRDHQFTTVALFEALQRWKRPVALMLYTNHADRNRYPYGPAGTLMSLPPVANAVVPVDRVYSHPLSIDLQRRKLFALESMHDLRFSPTRQYQLARPDSRAVTAEKVGPEPDITYLRRAPRSTELFYLYERGTFDAMMRAYLTTKPPS